uniref:Solute carrier family 2 member 9, like 1 n=1 Tax=Xiphophorus couchianus TaxID=32473 RepID=A0A3B5LS73_9TELE
MLDFATVEFAVNVFTVLSRSFALKSFVCFHASRLYVCCVGHTSVFTPSFQTQGNALLVIIILGCGGSFHTGYHLTGLSSPSPHIQHFINSSWYDRYKESPGPEKVTLIWSLIISMYAVGGLFGAVSVKLFSRKLGRCVYVAGSLISVMGAVIMLTSKTAKSFEMIIVARMLYGYSAGLGASLHSMYLGEISPRKIRGRVTLTSATFTSLGKLSGQFFGLSEILGHRDLWNIVLCVPVCFSAVQVLVLPFLPEAPRYLFIEKRDDKACKRGTHSPLFCNHIGTISLLFLL